MATSDNNTPVAEATPVSFYEDVENLKKLCNFLRSKEGPPVREAIELDKRVHYLKGACDNDECTCRNASISQSFLILSCLVRVSSLINRRKTRQFPDGAKERNQMAVKLAAFQLSR